VSEPLTTIVMDLIEDSPGATVDDILVGCDGYTRKQVLTAVHWLAGVGRVRCVRQAGRGRQGGSFPGRYYPDVTIRDQIVQRLEIVSKATAAEMADLLGVAPRQVMTALTDLCAQDRVHVCGDLPSGGRGRPQCLYRLGRKPGWLPHPMPANSVFALGAMA
jgi:hypothetical protein